MTIRPLEAVFERKFATCTGSLVPRRADHLAVVRAVDPGQARGGGARRPGLLDLRVEGAPHGHQADAQREAEGEKEDPAAGVRRPDLRMHRGCTLPFRFDAREHGQLRDKHALGRETLAGLFFLALAIAATRPLAAVLRSHVLGQLDVLVDLWTVHWLATHFFDPSQIFQGNIFNPARADTVHANDTCIQCHSQGQPLTNPIEGRYYDWPVGFHVGQNLSDFWRDRLRPSSSPGVEAAERAVRGKGGEERVEARGRGKERSQRLLVLGRIG